MGTRSKFLTMLHSKFTSPAVLRTLQTVAKYVGVLAMCLLAAPVSAAQKNPVTRFTYGWRNAITGGSFGLTAVDNRDVKRNSALLKKHADKPAVIRQALACAEKAHENLNLYKHEHACHKQILNAIRAALGRAPVADSDEQKADDSPSDDTPPQEVWA